MNFLCFVFGVDTYREYYTLCLFRSQISNGVPGGSTVTLPPPCDRTETRSSNYRYNGGKDGYFRAYCPIRNKYQKCQRSKDEQV